MNNSKLIRVLNVFDSAEKKRLDLLITSAFFNENPEVIRFWSYVNKTIENNQSKKLAKETVFSKLYPDKPFNDAKIRGLMFKLMELVEKFIVLIQTEKNKYKYKALTQFYHDRYLEKDFQHALHEYEKFHFSISERDVAYYQESAEIAKWEMYVKLHDYQLYGDKGILEYIEKVDVAYILTQLELHNSVKNSQNVLNIEKRSTYFFDFVEKLSLDERLLKIPLFELMYYVWQMIHQVEKESYFDNVLEILSKYENCFTHLTHANMAAFLRNYCNKQIIRGRLDFKMRKHTLEIIRKD